MKKGARLILSLILLFLVIGSLGIVSAIQCQRLGHKASITKECGADDSCSLGCTSVGYTWYDCRSYSLPVPGTGCYGSGTDHKWAVHADGCDFYWPCDNYWLEEYQCSGNNLQQKFKTASCGASDYSCSGSDDWITIQTCPNGCDPVTKTCMSCTPGNCGSVECKTFPGSAPSENYCPNCFFENLNDRVYNPGLSLQLGYPVYNRYLISTSPDSINKRCQELGYETGSLITSYPPNTANQWCGSYGNAGAKTSVSGVWQLSFPCTIAVVKSGECCRVCTPVPCVWGSWGTCTGDINSATQTRTKTTTESCGGACSGTSTQSCSIVNESTWLNLKGVPILSANKTDIVLLKINGLGLIAKDINYTIYYKSTSSGTGVIRRSFIKNSPTINQFLNLPSYSLDDSGYYYFNASVENLNGKSGFVSSELSASLNPNNFIPVAIISSPIEDKIGLTSWFNHLSYDEDDLLNVTWDFGDGTTSLTYSDYSLYLTPGLGNVQHTYSNPGEYTVKLTIGEMTRGQVSSQSKTIHVVKEGINVFPVISSPQEDGIYADRNILFNISQSYIVDCSLLSTPPIVSPNFTVGPLYCRYIHYPDQKTTPGYNITVNITSEGNSIIGDWQSDYEQVVKPIISYSSNGKKSAKITLTYNKSTIKEEGISFVDFTVNRIIPPGMNYCGDLLDPTSCTSVGKADSPFALASFDYLNKDSSMCRKTISYKNASGANCENITHCYCSWGDSCTIGFNVISTCSVGATPSKPSVGTCIFDEDYQNNCDTTLNNIIIKLNPSWVTDPLDPHPPAIDGNCTYTEEYLPCPSGTGIRLSFFDSKSFIFSVFGILLIYCIIVLRKKK